MPRHTTQQADAFRGSLKPYEQHDTWKEDITGVKGRAGSAVSITELQCPRRSCRQTFIVRLPALKRIKRQAEIKTCPCPYCSKVSLLP